ncbi:rhodanese-like domain-containing protein [Roseimaritima sediminicola]|uniref:rhodanese-like domain-containing protein n=1 Tax=Roseimaritima sediminicola TaxID=2662066 RepID=UPI001298553F|nr:rhodanese-like domain-containing protein [Roseimaritima sediminicola]
MKTVTTERLQTLIEENKDFLLVNTLDPEDFAKTRIQGAINIPVSQDDFVDNVVRAAGSKQKLIIVYCASRQCDSSTKAAKRLDEAGVNVADFEGGAAAWQEAGQPLVNVEVP